MLTFVNAQDNARGKEEAMEKRITVMVAEAGTFHDLTILPGTTAREILNQANLGDQYVLGTGRNQEPLANDENVYEKVSDGSKLYAFTPVDVGA